MFCKQSGRDFLPFFLFSNRTVTHHRIAAIRQLHYSSQPRLGGEHIADIDDQVAILCGPAPDQRRPRTAVTVDIDKEEKRQVLFSVDGEGVTASVDGILNEILIFILSISAKSISKSLDSEQCKMTAFELEFSKFGNRNIFSCPEFADRLRRSFFSCEIQRRALSYDNSFSSQYSGIVKPLSQYSDN